MLKLTSSEILILNSVIGASAFEGLPGPHQVFSTLGFLGNSCNFFNLKYKPIASNKMTTAAIVLVKPILMQVLTHTPTYGSLLK